MKKLFFLMLLLFSIIPVLQPPSAYAHSNNSKGYSNIEVNGKYLDYELKVDLSELGKAINKEMVDQQLFDTQGIEIGQLIIILVIFPFLIWLKQLPLKPVRWLLPGTSVVILAFGLIWFIERAF